MSVLIETKQLSYRYPNRGLVLDQVNFQLKQHEKIALVGVNGAGKTTLLHLLVGLLQCQSGEIHAFGQPRFQEKHFVELRQKIGFVFQDPDDQLFCPTVLEDVMFGPLNQGLNTEQAKRAALQILAQLQLSDLADSMASELSGGEKRMVSLASVLVMQPKVLLLDEPTNALDSQAKARLLALLQSLPQAMLIISHDEDFLAELATGYLKLEAGVLQAG